MNYKSLFKSFFSFSIGNWLGIIIGAISTPVLTRILTPDQLGKASMFTLALNILMLFSVAGTDQAFVRLFYEEEKNNRNKLLYKILKVPLIIFTLTSISILLFNEKLSMFLFDETNTILIFVLIIALFFNILKRYSFLVIRMQQKGLVYSLLNFSYKLFGLLFIFPLIKLVGNSYTIRIYSIVFAIILTAITAILLGKENWIFFNLKEKKINNSLKNIIKYSYPLLFASLISWLFQSFDKIAIRQWSTYNQLGLYAAAYKIVGLINVVRTSFATFWTPTSLKKYENDKNDTKFFSNIYQLIFITMSSMTVLVILFKNLINILLGSGYSQAIMIMPVLLLMPMMYTLSEVTVVGINFNKKTKWHIFIAAISCVFNIGGNYFLVPKIGAKGAAISTGLAYIIFFTLRTFISLRYFKVDYKLKKSYLFIILILFYALYSTFFDILIINILFGLIILFLLIAMYYKDIIKVYNNLKK